MLDSSLTRDDETLVNAFVKGDTKILSSQNLRMYVNASDIQLTTKNCEAVGILKLSQKPWSIVLKYGYKDWEPISEILLENNFIPFGKPDQKTGNLEYKQQNVPAGYKVKYTDTRILWKTWWPNQRRSTLLQTNLLIFTRNTWYPIQNVVAQDGKVFIKTLIGESQFSLTDKLVWLSKETSENSAKNISSSSPKSTNDSGSNSGINNFSNTESNNSNIESNNNIRWTEKYLNRGIVEAIPGVELEQKQQKEEIQRMEKPNPAVSTSPPHVELEQKQQKEEIQRVEKPNPAVSTSPPHVELEQKQQKEIQRLEKQITAASKTEVSVELESKSPNKLKELRKEAIKKLADYLVNGETETITEVVKDAKGEITSTKVITIKKPCNQWVVETILKRNNQLMN